MSERVPVVVPFLTPCVLGVIAGYCDLRFSEVQSSVLLLLVFTFVMGACFPRRAWLWALLIGAGVFEAHVVARLIGFVPTDPPNHLAETLLALVPAMIGAYAGVGARAVLGAGSSRL